VGHRTKFAECFAKTGDITPPSCPPPARSTPCPVARPLLKLSVFSYPDRNHSLSPVAVSPRATLPSRPTSPCVVTLLKRTLLAYSRKRKLIHLAGQLPDPTNIVRGPPFPYPCIFPFLLGVGLRFGTGLRYFVLYCRWVHLTNLNCLGCSFFNDWSSFLATSNTFLT